VNLELLQQELETRSGRSTASHSAEELAPIGDALQDPDLHAYLSNCLPPEVVEVSGVRLLSLHQILDEIYPGSTPGSQLHRFDYVPIATSIGGNCIVVHAWGDRRAKVYWADHTGWYEDSIAYQDRVTRDWIDLPGYSPENVERALVPLATDLETFLLKLLRDELTKELDLLD
jgi:hypothetical protein